MADSRCFVQFPHPGGEYRPRQGGDAAWNTLRAAHARKFMQTSGEWIEADGSTRPRPSIHLPECCFTQNLRQGHKLGRDLDVETLRHLWESLVAQVRDAGLVVGIHAALPQRRDACGANGDSL